ncbi:twin-arginine translocase subunit TatC [Halalkalibacterium halodurans]|uniref:twin-arginine translocase subunit TatC n=1 Tax=Halalkalibacterium halodurans TaxID=86665 RepID=UPI002E1BF757|nr:twin-arginine translocase subunit TatC [Halalkalibacterium halodurans]MED4079618.1 twin-arginine translocase subunit TatC [Halalkalibacterium halodurans]MED4084105.1 twin-arginine translocase subunit TatC [Halalkalibacterium halodurans]MED4104583.1 twin-arginine translocase subunit TatC [Halalkalibacterium halodurans]MED4108311.1 twin-arginine translocase subunit TatC [Halalkalibacterium halodurans]MED4147332.1 twin-arginine translocase subunit TatC [Halalkalibacterium halodurans]
MDKQERPFIDHLAELRKRIIVTMLTFIVALIGTLIFVKDVYLYLVKDLDGKLALLGPGDILWVYMTIAAVLATAVTIPIAAYQVWRFVQPGLTKGERQATLVFIPGLFFFFIAGIAFGYFVLFPLVLTFLSNLIGDQFETMFTAEKYFQFMLHLTLPFGFLFEMPAVIMFLTKLGVLTPEKLSKGRKYAYFLLIILSVVITPPDFLSDVLVIVPLFILYEISVSLSKLIYRKKESSELSVA